MDGGGITGEELAAFHRAVGRLQGRFAGRSKTAYLPHANTAKRP